MDNNNEHKHCLDCVFCAEDGYGRHHCSYYSEPLVSADDYKQAKTCEQFDND